MIQFSIVHGDVFVQDIDRGYNQMAWSGMELDDNGNYLIATTGTSEATIYTNGNTFELKSSSFARIRGNRTWWDRHHESWTGDARLFIGKLWARICKDPRDPGGPNASIGVRG